MVGKTDSRASGRLAFEALGLALALLGAGCGAELSNAGEGSGVAEAAPVDVVQPRSATQAVTCAPSLHVTLTTFAAEGSSGTATVTADAGCPWTLTSTQAWLVVGQGSGTGSASVPFTVAVNTGTTRTAALNLGASSVTITQNADVTAPSGTLALSTGLTVTRTRSVTLKITGSDLSGVPTMCVSNTATCTSFRAFATILPWSLPSTGTSATVSLWLKDGRGNVSPTPITLAVVLDTVAPTDGTLSAAVASGQATLSWSGFADPPNGVASYRLMFARSATAPSSCASGTPIYTGALSSFVHADLNNGSTYSWRVCAVDAAGNISVGKTVTARVKPESVAPEGTVTINGDAAYARSTSVTLTLAAVDPSGVKDMCISATASCKTWVPFRPTAPFRLASGAGDQVVNVWFRDVWENTSNPVSDTISVDTTPPTNGSVTAVAGDAQVALSPVGFGDNGSGLGGYRVLYRVGAAIGSCAVANVPAKDFAEVSSLVVDGLTNGSVYNFRVCARDAAGNLSSGVAVSAKPVPEREPPEGSVVIADGAAFVRTTTVTLTLNARDASRVTKMCIASSATCTSYVAYAPTRSFTLSSGAGRKTVNAWFQDEWGNTTSLPASTTVVLDTTPPLNGSVTSQGGHDFVKLLPVNFTDPGSDIAGYRVLFATGAVASSCSATGAAFREFGAAQQLVVDGLNTNTTYNFRVCARDGAGNLSTGVTVSGRTMTEQDPPVGTVSIAGGAPFTTDATVALTLGATDASTVTSMCISTSTACTAWEAYSASKSLRLSDGSGTKSVYAWFRDQWGNTTREPVSDAIVLDTTLPFNGTVLAAASTGSVSLSWSGFSDAPAGVVGYRVAHAALTPPATCTQGTVLQFGNVTSAVVMNLPEGQVRGFRVCAMDAAGNISSGITMTATPLASVVEPEHSGAISGRVVLSATTGMNDMGRVRVTLDNGGGSAVVEDDGLFLAEGLAANTYNMTVIYEGGLTPEATGSVYQPYTRRVRLAEGASLDVGDIVLVPARGAVEGVVALEPAPGSTSVEGDAELIVQLRLEDGSVRETSVAADGSYQFLDVPVGFHELQAAGEGFATPLVLGGGAQAVGELGALSATFSASDGSGNGNGNAGGNGCGARVSVGGANEVAQGGALRLVQARASLVPNDGEVMDRDAPTWLLRSGVSNVTIRALTGFARRGRGWFKDGRVPPPFVDDVDQDGITTFTFAVAPGAHTISLELGDGCGYTTPTIEKVIVRDDTAPEVTDAYVVGAVVGSDGRALVPAGGGVAAVAVEALDELAGVAAVAVEFAPDLAGLAALDVNTLTFEPLVPRELARVTRMVEVPAQDGAYVVGVFLQDAAGNVARPEVGTPSVIQARVDRTPPRIDAVVIGDGRAATNTVAPVVRVDAADAGSGVARLQTSLTGAFTLPSVPFSPTTVVVLDDGTPGGGDGPKTVYVRVADAAGNVADATASVVLDRRAPTGTLRRAGGGTALSGRGPVTITLEHDEDVVGVGMGLMDAPCGGGAVTEPDQPSRTDRVLDVQSPDGLVLIHACLRDAAGNEARLVQVFTLDTTPPIGVITAANGAAYVHQATVDVAISLADAGAVVRLGEAALGAVPSAAEACAGDEGYAAITGVQRVTLAAEGHRVVWACLRDPAGNTGFAMDDVVYDAQAPAVRAVTLGDGSGTTSTPDVLVTLDVEGASEMKLGFLPGLAGVSYQPFLPRTRVTLPAGDGQKLVYVRFRDDAGNETAEQAYAITLNSKGTVRGRVFVEGRSDGSVAEVRLLGTALVGVPAADGSFTIADVPAGLYTVEATVRSSDADATRFLAAQTGVAVEALQASTTPDLLIPRKRGNLGGVVTLESTVAGASNAGVLLELVEAGLSTTTGADGAFVFSGVLTGTYTVRASKPGYVTTTVSPAIVEYASTATLTFPDALQLVRGGVGLRVLLEDGASPTAAQAILTGPTPASAFANAEGALQLESLLPGAYTLELRVPTGGYDTLTQPITVVGGQRVELPVTTLPLARGNIAVTVRLEDETDHSGVTVEATGSGVVAVTDGLGSATLSGVPVGTYTLRLSKTNFSTVEQAGVVVTARATTRPGTATLPVNRGAITGVALFDDASAHGGIAVSIMGSTVSATTDEAGAFTLTGVKPGTWNVIAQSASYTAARESGLFVGPGQTIDLGTLTLTRKRGPVAGRVTVEGTTDATGVVVAVQNTSFRTFPDAAGNYTLSIPVGNYDGVVASRPFFADAAYAETVTVTDVGAFTVPTLQLRQQSGLVSGTVTLPGSFPGDAEGSVVTLVGSPGSAADGVVVRALADVDGFFSFDQPEDFQVVSAGTTVLTGGSFPFRGIPVGAYRLTAMEPEPPAGQTRTRDVALRDVVVSALSPTVVNVSLPNVYVTIADGAAVSLSRTVLVKYGATNCVQVRLTVDAPPTSATPFEACTGSKTITFPSDGTHVVYAEFDNDIFDDLPVVSDDIFVDSTAVLTAFTHNVPAGVKKALGDTVTFSATGESGATAVAAITGYDSAIRLTESPAGSGSYTAAYVLRNRIDIQPTSNNASTGSGTVVLTFTDRYGNVVTRNANTTTSGSPATTTTTHTPITIGVPPFISNIRIIPDVVAQNATVTFTTDETASTVVRVGKTESSLCLTSCATTASGTSHSVVITGTQAGEAGGLFLRNTPYYVRIDATDARSNTSNSATLQFFVAPNAPTMVVPIPMDSRVLVRWEAPPQEDLSGYYVERSEDGGEFVRVSGATPYNHEVLTYDDHTVVNGRQYTYRVRAVDLYGNASEPATTTDMARNTDGTVDATKLAAFSECGTVTPAPARSTAGRDVQGGVLPLCSVWTDADGLISVVGSVAVPVGGILIMGPRTRVEFNRDTQLVVQGRIAIYGDRGRFFDLPNELVSGWEIGPVANGVPREEADGVINVAPFTGYRWQGILIRNRVVFGDRKVSTRSYLGGDIFYRASFSGCYDVCFDTDSAFTLIRGEVTDGGNVRRSSTPVFFGGARAAGNMASQYSKTYSVDSFMQVANQGWIDGRALLVFEGSVALLVGPYLVSYLSDSIVLGRGQYDQRQLGIRSAVGFSGAHVNGTNYFTGYDTSAVRLVSGGSLTHSHYSSVVYSQYSQYQIVASISSRMMSFHNGFVNNGGANFRNSAVVTVGCSTAARARAGYMFGSTLTVPGLRSDCPDQNGDNYAFIHDFNDDVTLGVLAPGGFGPGTYPRPLVDGPMRVQRSALSRGVVLRAYGDDLEDGALPAEAAYWTNSSGVIVGTGPLLTLPTTLGVGTTTYTARVVDSDGLESDIPWPVEVINDAGLAESYMWPDAKRWRVAALRMDQLPPKANATPVATFRWRCFTPDCTATCALDPDPNADVATVATAPCRSPVEVAGLAPGTHTFVIQPRDANGNAIDLPQRYTWTVAATPTTLSDVSAAPGLRVMPGNDDATDVVMVSGDTPNQVVTCSVDGRHELPCLDGLSIPRIGANGEVTRDLTVRVRSRETGMELQPSRGVRLNDPEDLDGDGWLDVSDPCLRGAERGAACEDADADGVLDDDDLCPAGEPFDNVLVQVTAGARHTCALRANGTVFCSGQNHVGQLGDTTTGQKHVPVPVSGIGATAQTRAVAIDAGAYHTCAVLVNRTLRCWGYNNHGQLGNNTTTNATTPVEVQGLTNVVSVNAGGEHTCAVLSDDTVRCWGRNTVGQLGDGTFTTPRRTPVTVTGLTNVANVSAGLNHTCAALKDGTARCWGESDDGRLGTGAVGADSHTPMAVANLTDVVRVVAGRGQSCALRTGGALSCWGDNREAGALGIGSTVSPQPTPVEVYANGVHDLGIAVDDSSTTSSTATMCAITDFGFRCWGRNTEGQYGDGSVESLTTPTIVRPVTNAAAVATGVASTCVLKLDGSVSCWGRGAEGQLGHGSNGQLLTAPSVSPPGFSPVPFLLGPVFDDLDGDGCADP